MYLVFRLCGKREIRIYGYEVDVWLGKNITLEREVYFSYMTTGRICRQSVHIFSIRNANPSPPEKRNISQIDSAYGEILLYVSHSRQELSCVLKCLFVK